jgi:hypothetical protein
MPDDDQNRILLYGSNFVEVQPSTTGAAFGSSQTFTFSNDVDALGDMYARIVVKLKSVTSSTGLQALSLARIIDRLEVQVGNSTWQTMENADILAMAATQLDSGAYDVYAAQAGGGQQLVAGKDQKLDLTPGAVVPSNAQAIFVAWVPLPTFTQGGPQHSHLIAGAPHQSVRVKLTYVAASAFTKQTNLNPTTDGPSLDSVQLWNRQHIMTNFEREQIRNNTIAKTIHLTQHAEHTALTSDTNMTVELDSFSLLASHLIISAETSDETAGTGTQPVLQSAELLLNTSTHSGPLDGSFMISSTGQSMGLKTNLLAPYSDQPGNRREFYVFPLAARPYGPDGCPLNRFDTIRLRLTWANFPGQVHVTCVGTTTAVYKNQAASVLYFS